MKILEADYSVYKTGSHLLRVLTLRVKPEFAY